jgi:hypothetical protein
LLRTSSIVICQKKRKAKKGKETKSKRKQEHVLKPGLLLKTRLHPGSEPWESYSLIPSAEESRTGITYGLQYFTVNVYPEI